MQSEANVYVNLALKVTILVYVDDLMAGGSKQAIADMVSTISKGLILNRA